jgi:hypothetical protein
VPDVANRVKNLTLVKAGDRAEPCSCCSEPLSSTYQCDGVILFEEEDEASQSDLETSINQTLRKPVVLLRPPPSSVLRPPNSPALIWAYREGIAPWCL